MKQFVKYLEERVTEYSDLFNVNNWQIRVEQKISKNEDLYMSVGFIDGGYTTVALSWGKEALKDFKKKDWPLLEKAVLHELTHVLIRDLMCTFYRSFPTKAEVETQHERLCENLSVIIHKLLK